MLYLELAVLVILFSLQSLFTKMYSDAYDGKNRDAATGIFSVTYGLFIAIATFLSAGLRFDPSPATLLYGALNACVLLLYNISIINSAKRGSYAFLMICSMFGGILVPLTGGWILFGETLTPLQLLGIALMLAAMLLMNSSDLSLKGSKKGYFLWCALLFLANGLYGTVMNVQSTVMEGRERSEMLIVLFGLSSVFAYGLEAFSGRGRDVIHGYKMSLKPALFLACACLSAFLGANLLLYLLTRMQSGILYTIDDGGVLLLSLLFSVVLFKEKLTWLQALGMALALGSIVLVNA
ncbi:MAG: EamA family transporter [Clostridia bacterium]|nr:EamA family transporter [Clostridia bacterium]